MIEETAGLVAKRWRALWTIFSIIAVPIKVELGLNDTQFGLLMVSAAAATWLLTFADSYATYLLAGPRRRHRR